MKDNDDPYFWPMLFFFILTYGSVPAIIVLFYLISKP